MENLLLWSQKLKIIFKMKLKPLTYHDINSISHVHTLAFPRSLLTCFGNEAIRRYYHWLFFGPHSQVYPLGMWKNEKLCGFIFAGKFNGAFSGYIKKNIFYLLLITIFNFKVLFKNLNFWNKVLIFIKINFAFNKRTHPLIQDSSCSVSFGLLIIAVLPEMQRQGIGTKLIHQLEKFAKSKKYQFLNLTVEKENKTALNFYLKHGWKIVRESKKMSLNKQLKYH